MLTSGKVRISECMKCLKCVEIFELCEISEVCSVKSLELKFLRCVLILLFSHLPSAGVNTSKLFYCKIFTRQVLSEKGVENTENKYNGNYYKAVTFLI